MNEIDYRQAVRIKRHRDEDTLTFLVQTDERKLAEVCADQACTSTHQ